MSLLRLTTRVWNVAKVVNSTRYVRAFGSFARLHNVRAFSTSTNNKIVSKVDLANKEAKSRCVKAPIPKLRSDDDLRACYAIGGYFCYKTISVLDRKLGSYAREIVTDMGFLSKNSTKKGNKDTLSISLDRQDYEDFSKSQFSWENRRETLIKEQVLEHNGMVSKTQQPRLGMHATQDINTAIKNIETMLVIRNSVLYSE